jgi:hypothetical protein
MDSSVYKYLIEKILSDPDIRFDSLPEYFTRSPSTHDRDAMQSLGLFLKNLIGPGLFWTPGKPEILVPDDSFFHSLFLSAHESLFDVLSGAEPSVHPFRSNGTQLVRFLAFCACDDQALFVQDTDASSCAMFCFLSEGMMHCGWCPNTFEGKAKRAAHSYFIVLKKSLHHANAESLPAVLGYLWGAWLLARKTEGIQTSPSAGPSAGPSQDCGNGKETFDWKSGTGRRLYIAKRTAAPFLFYILAKISDAIPHPFRYIMNDGGVGLSVRVNREAIRPVSLADSIEINRQKISGDRFVYNCTTDSIPDITWTVAILTYESTLYRIDFLKFPPGTAGKDETEAMFVETEMKLECGIQPQRCGINSFFSKGLENTVIRFLDSPLEFEFDRMEKNGVSVYKASTNDNARTLKIVTGWATGRGISAINETKLLGMYE